MSSKGIILVKKDHLFIGLVGTSIFFISIFLGPYYIGGDQRTYRFLYDGLSGLSIFDGFIFYTSNIDSIEPGYFFYSWIFSNLGFEKDLFVALFNTFLAIFSYILLRRIGASHIFIAFLLIFNFYAYVLYFSADRLKFAVLFFVISILVLSKKMRAFWAAMSIVTHIQMGILYSSIAFSLFSRYFFIVVRNGRVSVEKIKLIFLVLIFSTFFLFLMKEQIVAKLVYFEVRHFSELIRSLVFFLMALYCAKQKKLVLYLFIPLLIAVFFLGGMRLNIFSFFVFIYFATQDRGGLNLPYVLTSLYFAYGALGFVSNIIMHGDGFH